MCTNRCSCRNCFCWGVLIGQRQAASAQERAQARATELEQARYLDQVNAARVQQAQEQVARAQRIGAASRGNQLAMARARVAAGEAGVTGLSVQALIDSMTANFARNRFSETRRAEMQDVNRNLALNDLAMRSKQNLLGINQPIQQENPLQALLTGVQVGTSMQSVAQDWGNLNKGYFDFNPFDNAVPVRDDTPPRRPVIESVTPARSLSFTNVTPDLPSGAGFIDPSLLPPL